MITLENYTDNIYYNNQKLQRLLGRREALLQEVKTSEITEQQKLEFLHIKSRAKIVLEYFVKNTENTIKEKIEPIITEALHFIFKQPLFFRAAFIERRGQIETDFIILPNSEKEKEYQSYLSDTSNYKDQLEEMSSTYSDILFMYGGAILEVTGLLLELIIGELLQISGPICLDEPTKSVHEEYAARVGIFIKSLSEKFDRQIIYVTHSNALASSANKVYRIKKEGDISYAFEE